MLYLKVDGGNLFAYEQKSATTLVFFKDNWEISSMSFNALLIEGDVKFLSESEALKITKNVRPDSVLKKIENFQKI